MSPALFPSTLIRRDYDSRRVGRGRAGDHVLEKLLVPGRIDDGEPALSSPKMDLGGVDRDILLLLFSEHIEDKRVFKPPAFPLTRGPDRLELSFRKRVRRFEDPPNYSRLSMVDMSDEYDLHMNPFARSFCIACGSWWSWARPARSLDRVVSSSAMMSSIVAALLATGWVMGW